jgi:hypothetical protein
MTQSLNELAHELVLKHAGENQVFLAKRCGVSQSTIVRIFQSPAGEYSIEKPYRLRRSTLEKIVAGLS